MRPGRMGSSLEIDTIAAALSEAERDTLEQRPRETWVPPQDGEGADPAAPIGVGLALQRTLGEGGMGIVRLATQRSLGRDVAVKTVKGSQAAERATGALLREACVMGLLEHPNVVPVYDLVVGDAGEPAIVMRKIEGSSWASVMHDPAALRARFDAEDALEWNLRVLAQVCNVVDFAHSRGILHRDLKPENVMLGEFGEVYVVDWGLAVALREGLGPAIPLAAEATRLAGTPCYMAPEMLGGGPSRLGPRTDVYLLGAVLFEIAAGEPPHRGETFMQLVATILTSEPALPGDVPPELAAIILRAMATEPGERFRDARELRVAVERFLTHRQAARIAELARERLGELVALAEAGRSDAETEQRLYWLFGEVMFGFRQALRTWSGDEASREGMERAASAMAHHELALGRPEAARALLSELPRPPAELSAKVEEACRAKESEALQLRSLSADLDPMSGRRGRVTVAIVMGLAWIASPSIAGAFVRAGVVEMSSAGDVLVSLALLVLLAILGVRFREALLRTAINRRLAAAALVGVALQGLTAIIGHVLERSPWVTVHERLALSSGLVALLATSVHRGLAVTAAVYAAGYALVPLVGLTNGLFVLGACNAVMIANLLVLWRRARDRASPSGAVSGSR